MNSYEDFCKILGVYAELILDAAIKSIDKELGVYAELILDAAIKSIDKELGVLIFRQENPMNKANSVILWFANNKNRLDIIDKYGNQKAQTKLIDWYTTLHEQEAILSKSKAEHPYNNPEWRCCMKDILVNYKNEDYKLANTNRHD